MLNTNFPPWPSFTQEEADAVSSVLLSNKVNYWTGKECRAFESEFAEWVGAKHAVAVANGTVALDAALAAIGIQPGDEVISTPRTFVASSSSVVMAGGTPIFADVDLDTQNISATTIEPCITKKTKAIICVHLAGMPCDMDPIIALADKHNLIIIEDCAQAHGAKYKGQSVGTLGHVAAWSFCQDKIMTTGGEGGMVTTNHEDIWKKVWSYKDHGKNWDTVYEKTHAPGFRWLHESFGTNGRMIEMEAAIGRIQLKRMPQWQAQRLQNAQTIWQAAKQNPYFYVPEIPDWALHAAYKCYIFVSDTALANGHTRESIVEQIGSQGVPCYSGSCSEIYREKAFADAQLEPRAELHNAKWLGQRSIMFLVHPTLEQKHIDKTCDVLSHVLCAA